MNTKDINSKNYKNEELDNENLIAKINSVLLKAIINKKPNVTLVRFGFFCK